MHSSRGSSWPQGLFPTLTDMFFTSSASWEAPSLFSTGQIQDGRRFRSGLVLFFNRIEFKQRSREVGSRELAKELKRLGVHLSTSWGLGHYLGFMWCFLLISPDCLTQQGLTELFNLLNFIFLVPLEQTQFSFSFSFGGLSKDRCD